MATRTSRGQLRRACIETLESRQLLAAVPLHISGNHVVDSSNNTVRLLGANAPSLSWNNTGDNLEPSIAAAYDLWKSNCVRLPLSQDRWFGYAGQSDGGASYKALVDKAVQIAVERNAYIIIDLHWSDEGVWGQNLNQQRMADDNSTTFWNDVANRYKNNSSVIFELYNEPHDIDWNTWKNGGTVTDNVTYHTPGMQGLLNTVRATGATNIVIAGGLDWCYDLSGVGSGYALSDSTGNIMYGTHPYPWKLNWDAAFGNVSNTYAVIATEFGHWDPNDSGHNSLNYGDQAYQTWCPSILNYFDSKGISWTGWSFHNGASPDMISDWNYTPTYYWGQYAHDRLAQLAPSRTLGSFTTTTTINTTQPGAAYQVAGSSGTYIVNSGGSDIWGTSDQFQYLYSSTSGDQTVIARVADVPVSEYTNGQYSRGGIMFRNDTTGGSINIGIYAAAGNNIDMTWRDTANGTAAESGWSTGNSTPRWVKLVKSGSTITGYYANTTGTPASGDWIQVASHSTPLSSTYLAGLAATPCSTGTTTGVTFTGVSASFFASLPGTPSGLTATATSSSQINLSWNAASGATSYNVYRSTTPGGEGSTPIATGISSTSYSSTGLASSTTYYYTVAAVNGSGTSSQSAEASATTQVAIPGQVTGLSATAASTTQINLSWSAVSGATSYSIYRSTTSGGEGTTAIATGITSTSWSNTGLSASTTYYYKVAAVNSAGTGTQSAEASATTQSSSSLSAPTNVTATAVSSTQINLSWNAVSGASSYRIYRGTAAGGEGSAPYATVSTTSYSDTACSASTRYYYTVVAVSSSTTQSSVAVTNGDFENANIANWDSTVPGAVGWTTPSSNTATKKDYYAHGGSYDVSMQAGDPAMYQTTGWTMNTGDQFSLTVYVKSFWQNPGYDVCLYSLESDGSRTRLATQAASSTTSGWMQITVSYTAVAANAGKKIGIQIGSTGTTGSWMGVDDVSLAATSYIASSQSSEVNATTQSTGGLAAPTGLTATAVSTSQINLAWNAVSGASSYNIYRSTTSGGEGSTPYATVSTNSYSDTACSASTRYYYTVQAVGSSSQSSITVTNGNFESANLVNWDDTTPGAVGWTTPSSNTATKKDYYAHGGSYDVSTQAGDPAMYQTTGWTINTGDQFQLTLYVKSFWQNPGYDIYLYSLESDNSHTRLATQTASSTGSGWTQITITYTAVAANAGKKIGIQIGSTGTAGSWMGVDDVSLSVTSGATSSQSSETSATTQSSGALPAGYTDADINGPSPAGSATYNNSTGTFTINGSGADMWDSSDQFNYVYTSTSGNRTLTTRVTGLTNTHTYAKAGLLFRASTANNSAFVMLDVTPSGTIEFINRATTGASAACPYYYNTGITPSASTPIWLKLVQSNGTYTAYYATSTATPTTWTQLGSVSNITGISTSSYLAGLLVCSHNPGVLATGTFDNYLLA